MQQLGCKSPCRSLRVCKAPCRQHLVDMTTPAALRGCKVVQALDVARGLPNGAPVKRALHAAPQARQSVNLLKATGEGTHCRSRLPWSHTAGWDTSCHRLTAAHHHQCKLIQGSHSRLPNCPSAHMQAGHPNSKAASMGSTRWLQLLTVLNPEVAAPASQCCAISCCAAVLLDVSAHLCCMRMAS